MKTPRSVPRTILYIVLVVIGILVYAYGWQITDINLDVAQDESISSRWSALCGAC